MTIQVGDRLPEAKFKIMSNDGVQERTNADLFKNKKVVLFAVPGAFTPSCHKNHMPGYVENADAIKAKGVDKIYVTGVNDVFVMDAWKKESGAEGKIEFLADGNGDFAKALGLSLDASAHGLGLRSQRYVMIVNDGEVEELQVEDAPPNVNKSSAESLLKAL